MIRWQFPIEIKVRQHRLVDPNPTGTVSTSDSSQLVIYISMAVRAGYSVVCCCARLSPDISISHIVDGWYSRGKFGPALQIAVYPGGLARSTGSRSGVGLAWYKSSMPASHDLRKSDRRELCCISRVCPYPQHWCQLDGKSRRNIHIGCARCHVPHTHDSDTGHWYLATQEQGYSLQL